MLLAEIIRITFFFIGRAGERGRLISQNLVKESVYYNILCTFISTKGIPPYRRDLEAVEGGALKGIPLVALSSRNFDGL